MEIQNLAEAVKLNMNLVHSIKLIDILNDRRAEISLIVSVPDDWEKRSEIIHSDILQLLPDLLPDLLQAVHYRHEAIKKGIESL